jgi:replicative DNA helicase
MRRYRKANSVISLVLAAVLAVGCLPVGASAASSKEIQKQLDGLKSKKVELQKEIDAIQRGYDAIVVDYLQLINADGEKRWDIVTNISMQLHRLAQQIGVTVIGLSQITPPDAGGKKARLTMDSLRESRQLKHDADVILLLENCDDFPGGRTLTVAKNKDGRRNQGMKLVFDAEHMTFSYAKRKEPAQVPGQGAAMWDLAEDDSEGGDNPFDK